MIKYSYEFKKEIVMAYINGEGGQKYLAKKYDVKSPRKIIKWVKSYKKFGDDRLIPCRKNKFYAFDFKLSVVKKYLTSEVSYQDLALEMGISNPSLITKWVNDYRLVGPDALREKRKGRKPIVAKPKNIDNKDDSIKYFKQLKDENLRLRIENAYLKELRRLRLEQEALNEKRELSTTSEENSN